MTTTVMKNSIVGDQWIAQACQSNPVQPVLDDNGQPTGNYLTGPVRLVFPAVFEPKRANNNPQNKEKFSTGILFTPYSNLQPLYDAYYALLAKEFANYWVPELQNYQGVHMPFHDQGEKHQYSGFTPRLQYLTVTSNYKPSVVDMRMNPIVDQTKVYAGVWAIVSVNTYPYGKSPPQPKKGVGFGLQSVMIVGDDSRLDGGAPDPRQQFKGVQVRPPAVQPAAGFGQPMQPQAPAPGQGGPGAFYGQQGWTQPAPQPAAPAPGGVDTSSLW